MLTDNRYDLDWVVSEISQQLMSLSQGDSLVNNNIKLRFCFQSFSTGNSEH